jgi:hypothetical protein
MLRGVPRSRFANGGHEGDCWNLRDALPGKPWHGVKSPYAQRMNDEIGTAGEPLGGSGVRFGAVVVDLIHMSNPVSLTSDAVG